MEYVLKARSGQQCWWNRDYFLPALLEFEAIHLPHVSPMEAEDGGLEEQA